jgi:hypothetical protein
MRSLRNTLVIAVVLAIAPASVHAREFCDAEVVEAQLLPYAPYGSWLVTAALEVQPSNAPLSLVTLRETLPWSMTLRRGEVFRVDCQDIFRGQLSLAVLATAPSYRSSAARSSYYVRVR